MVGDFIAVKSYKAKGRRLTAHQIEQIEILEPIQPEIEEEEIISPEELSVENNGNDLVELTKENDEIQSIDISSEENDNNSQNEPNSVNTKTIPEGPIQMELEF
jgi:hypothetical protein